MSNDQKPQTDLDRVRKQKILVVVLLLGLGVALWKQPETESDIAETKAPNANPVQLLLTSSDNSGMHQDLTESFLVEDQLPTRSFAEISELELFREESSTHQPQPAAAKAPVVAIYGTASNRAALVGGKTIVRPGQSLPSVGHVVDVDGDGIHVKP